MLKYRNANIARVGFLGVVLVMLVIAVGLQPDRITSWANSLRYQAEFTEAGGLSAGNEVKVSGVKVGSVTDVTLGERGAVVTFVVDSRTRLGSQTTAHIRTGSLLGARIVTLEPSGRDVMHAGDVIPLSRTGSPYSLNEAVNDTTTNVAATDTESLNQSLDTLSATLDQVAPQLGPTLDGLNRLSTFAEQPQRNPRRVVETRRHRQPSAGRAQSTGQYAHPRCQRPVRRAGGAPPSHQRSTGQHGGSGRKPDRFGQGQRSRTGSDPGSAQRRHGDAREESRQPVQGAARSEEVRDHHQ